MNKFGLYLIVILSISTSVTFAKKLKQKEENKIEAKTFLQSSEKEKALKEKLECPYGGCGRPYDCDCGCSAPCGGHYGGQCDSGYFGGRYGCDSGYCGNKAIGHYGVGNKRIFGKGYRGKGYGCDSGYCGYKGNDCYGHGHKYFGRNDCDNDGFYGFGSHHGGYNDGFYGDYYGDHDCASYPSYTQGCARGHDYFTGKNDIRGKYITLEDAAALLGAERQRELAASKAYNNQDKNSCANSRSNYLDKDCDIHKKLCTENSCDKCNINKGKDACKNSCASAKANACNNDHNFSASKAHHKITCKNGKKEALCLNTNNLDKNFCDGNLLEEFDKLEHFKKCANGHKENCTGKDCTVKKNHHVHECKDSHSSSCDNNKSNKGSKSNSCSDAKDSFNYHEHDLANKDAKFNKLGKECKADNSITKACADASSKDNECKRQDSKEIKTENGDKILKVASCKDANTGCVDKSACVDASKAKDIVAQAVSSPVC